MRVNWQQSLEGCSLLEIRNVFRAIGWADSAFTSEFIAKRLFGDKYGRVRRSDRDRAKRLTNGLLVSGLIELDEGAIKPSIEQFILADRGKSLRAASAIKRFGRARADKAISNLLEVVRHINGNPLFLHDIEWVAVFGSYLDGALELGDIDVAIQRRARWEPGAGTDTDRTRRQKLFEKKYPPPESFYQKGIWRFWPEAYLDRLLARVDRGLAIIERSELEKLGCRHREIFPTVTDFAAKPDWRCDRDEILLKPDDGRSAAILGDAYERAKARARERETSNKTFLKRFRNERQGIFEEKQ